MAAAATISVIRELVRKYRTTTTALAPSARKARIAAASAAGSRAWIGMRIGRSPWAATEASVNRPQTSKVGSAALWSTPMAERPGIA
jgi:hypothetical protein